MKLKRVGAIAVCVVAGHCWANPILDQSFISPIRNFVIEGCCSAAQTFTVGISGTLAQINLDLRSLHDLPVLGINRALQIVRTVSGAPSNNALDILSTVALPIVEYPQLLAVDLSSFGIGVSAGELLGIELFGSFSWIIGSGYPGGMLFSGHQFDNPLPDLDAGFQTFVFVPEPNSVALVVVGIFGIAATKWRKQSSALRGRRSGRAASIPGTLAAHCWIRYRGTVSPSAGVAAGLKANFGRSALRSITAAAHRSRLQSYENNGAV